MYKLEDIRDVHLEITSKCQAKCPMCPRRINGGPMNPFIKLDDITLDRFKEWFPRQFIQQLNSCLLYTSPSPRDCLLSRMPSSA